MGLPRSSRGSPFFNPEESSPPPVFPGLGETDLFIENTAAVFFFFLLSLRVFPLPPRSGLGNIEVAVFRDCGNRVSINSGVLAPRDVLAKIGGDRVLPPPFFFFWTVKRCKKKEGGEEPPPPFPFQQPPRGRIIAIPVRLAQPPSFPFFQGNEDNGLCGGHPFFSIRTRVVFSPFQATDQ